MDPIHTRITPAPSFSEKEFSSSIILRPEDFRLPKELPKDLEKKPMTQDVVSFLVQNASGEGNFSSEKFPSELYKNLVGVYVKGMLGCLQGNK